MFLASESHDLSQAEKENVCTAKQIYKMTAIFVLNGHRLLFWVKKIVILRIYSALRAWDNSNDSGAKSWKVEDILTISVEVNHAGDIFEGTQQDIIGAFYLHLF